MKPYLLKVDETYTPLKLSITKRSDGSAGIPSMSGATATFTLWDTDEVTKLLDGEVASVEISGTTLLSVSYTFTSGNWSTIATAKGGVSNIPSKGYSADFKVTHADGVLFLPKQQGLERVPITIIAT